MKTYRELFGWDSNPFVFKILPEALVGNQNLREVSRSFGDEKFSLFIGPTGSGKTTLLKAISKKTEKDWRVLYIPKPPKEHTDWVFVFKTITQPRFNLFQQHNGVTIYNLSEKVNSKLGEKKCLLLVDECHEASMESLEWLRTLGDQIENLSLIMAGLPVFNTMLKERLETLRRRIGRTVELANLGRSESRELIKKRIGLAGGDDIKPFTSGAIEYVYERSGGFPREILRLCNELVHQAMEKGISTIDTDFVKEIEEPVARVTVDSIASLPERQRLIMDVLGKKGELTPAQIIQNIRIEEYKNKDNALRSVNNLLARLMQEKLVERKKVGKSYKYIVAGRYQTLLVEA